MTPRFEDGRAMLLAGIRRTHDFASAAEGIPRQWQDFLAQGFVGAAGGVTYGVLCGADPARQTMEYMCAVEVPSFGVAPEDAGRLRVPAQQYAVFTVDGSASGLASAWQWVWETWLPTSGYRMANTPEFERYDERFDAAAGRGPVELWCSIVADERPA